TGACGPPRPPGPPAAPAPDDARRRATRAARTSPRNARCQPRRAPALRAASSWRDEVALDVVGDAVRGPLEVEPPRPRREPVEREHLPALGVRRQRHG